MASLRSLARLNGIQPDYRDGLGRRCRVSDDTLLAVLGSMGSPVATAADATDALREALVERHAMLLPPVVALWGDGPHTIRLRVPPGAGRCIQGRLVQESREEARLETRVGQMKLAGRRCHEGVAREVREVDLGRLRVGYHELTIESEAASVRAHLIVAPQRTWVPAEAGRRLWGLFAPLHALRRDEARRVGTLADLVAVAEWSASLGARFVGLLPALATSGEVSPYSPLSRAFWSGLYLDPAWIDERLRDPAVQIESAPGDVGDGGARERLPAGSEVDFPASWRRTNELLERAQTCFDRLPIDHELRQQFQAFLERRPEARRFGQFRAVAARAGSDWRTWPQRLRGGDLEGGDFDARTYRRYVLEQWLAETQWGRAADACAAAGTGLYLDLPIGSPTASFDTWTEPGAYAAGCHVGAPPDAFFRHGQDWGIAPVDPAAMRRAGYEPWRRVLRHQMALADLLRIDHVMGLHRQFWIPQGGNPEQGTYVRYHAPELYAVLAIESHRSRTVVIGEDLGTVPLSVHEALDRRGVARMYVMQSRIADRGSEALFAAPEVSMACLGTHDMPTWAGYWRSADLDRAFALGRIGRATRHALRGERRALKAALVSTLRARGALDQDSGAEAVLHGCLRLLAISEAQYLTVDLDDLLGEMLGHNLPGAAVGEAGEPAVEAANWRRTNRVALGDLIADEPIRARLAEIERCRRRARSQ